MKRLITLYKFGPCEASRAEVVALKIMTPASALVLLFWGAFVLNEMNGVVIATGALLAGFLVYING